MYEQSNKVSPFGAIFLGVGIILFLITRITSCIIADTYEDLSGENVSYIAFYEYLEDAKSKKGKLLISMYKKEEINSFFKKYWGKVNTSMDRAWGKKFILRVRRDKGDTYFVIIKDDESNLIKINNADSFYTYSSNDGFKSYKLYNYFDILEKKEKELVKNRDR